MDNVMLVKVAESDRLFELREAQEAGHTYAKNLRVGDVFDGAGPAAISRGYANGTPCNRMFIFFALDELSKVRIYVQKDSRIITAIASTQRSIDSLLERNVYSPEMVSV